MYGLQDLKFKIFLGLGLYRCSHQIWIFILGFWDELTPIFKSFNCCGVFTFT
jgi:hypothetical protein